MEVALPGKHNVYNIMLCFGNKFYLLHWANSVLFHCAANARLGESAKAAVGSTLVHNLLCFLADEGANTYGTVIEQPVLSSPARRFMANVGLRVVVSRLIYDTKTPKGVLQANSRRNWMLIELNESINHLLSDFSHALWIRSQRHIFGARCY